MKNFIKYIGVMIQFLGVATLAVPFFCGFGSNKSLLVGLLIVVSGFLIQILIYKRVK